MRFILKAIACLAAFIGGMAVGIMLLMLAARAFA